MEAEGKLEAAMERYQEALEVSDDNRARILLKDISKKIDQQNEEKNKKQQEIEERQREQDSRKQQRENSKKLREMEKFIEELKKNK